MSLYRSLTNEDSLTETKDEVVILSESVSNIEGDILVIQADLNDIHARDPNNLNLSSVTQTEIDQVGNIGTNTISNTQWGYIKNLDQRLDTGVQPTFNAVNTTVIRKPATTNARITINHTNDIANNFTFNSTATNTFTFPDQSGTVLLSDNDGRILRDTLLFDSDVYFADNLDNSKRARFELGAALTGSTAVFNITSSVSGNNQITFPASGTLLTDVSSVFLSSKTLNVNNCYWRHGGDDLRRVTWLLDLLAVPPGATATNYRLRPEILTNVQRTVRLPDPGTDNRYLLYSDDSSANNRLRLFNELISPLVTTSVISSTANVELNPVGSVKVKRPLTVDQINEDTLNNGVIIEGVTLKDSLINTRDPQYIPDQDVNTTSEPQFKRIKLDQTGYVGNQGILGIYENTFILTRWNSALYTTGPDSYVYYQRIGQQVTATISGVTLVHSVGGSNGFYQGDVPAQFYEGGGSRIFYGPVILNGGAKSIGRVEISDTIRIYANSVGGDFIWGGGAVTGFETTSFSWIL